MSDLYVPRIVDGPLDELLVSFPAISLVGPRAAGKTTTAVRRGGTVLRLDRPEVRQSVAASPDAMLAGLHPPVILDEWQEVPELLGAVKRSVDSDPTPGRYILTGSIRAELENQVWPGTGRLLQVPMYGMSVREILGRAGMIPFIDRVIASGPDAVTAPDDALSIRDYLDLMLAGSFPEPSLRIPVAARRRWFAGYVEQMITRDVPAVAPRRNPELLRRYLSVLAVNTAGIAAESTLWTAAGINAKTAQAYQTLFQRMFVLDLVAAWCSNRIKRLVKAPKRYLVDPALVAAVLGLGRDAILYGPDMLGRLLDTFVAAQLRGELAASCNDPRVYHLREEQGRREVDLLIETAGGQLIDIEVKASAEARDARHARDCDSVHDAKVKLPLRTSLDVLTEVIYSLVGCGTSGHQEVILHYMDTADRQGALGARYQRPYAVPEALDLLRGPLSGTVHLPSHLDWSGNAVYDLDAPGRIVDLYRAVLIEAASPQDLYAYLDERVLRRLWALLWLPVQLRKAWEQRFPVMAEISRITATA